MYMYHPASLSVGVSDFIPSFIAERIINVGMEVPIGGILFLLYLRRLKLSCIFVCR